MFRDWFIDSVFFEEEGRFLGKLTDLSDLRVNMFVRSSRVFS